MISVIIATYNSAATLERTLESLRDQHDARFEVLLVDGGSKDRTLEIVERHSDTVTLLASEPDRGVYDAWNKAIPRAQGDWLMFLGSDDWLDRPGILAELEEEISALTPAQADLSFVYGETELKDEGRTIERLGRDPLPGNRLHPDQDTPFSHTGLLHHRSLFETFGPFDAGFRSAGDYEFLLRSAKDPQVRFRRVPMVVAQMAAGGMSTGAQSRLRHYREMQRARRLHGLRHDPLWLHFALLRTALVAFLDRYLGDRALAAFANGYRLLRGKPLRKRYQ